jgi:NTE family protein
MNLKLLPFFLAVLLFVGGCTHYPRNARLTSNGISAGYRFQSTGSPTNSSDLLLMLAFSGGGTRAAIDLRIADGSTVR